jgi:hypothetical protein
VAGWPGKPESGVGINAFDGAFEQDAQRSARQNRCKVALLGPKGIIMSEARIIDGKAFAAELRGRVGAEAARVKSEHGLKPGLAVVLVGENPASQVYVRSMASMSSTPAA